MERIFQNKIVIAIDSISDIIDEKLESIDENSLYTGKLGICLFKFYYLRYKGRSSDEAYKLLISIYNEILSIDMVDERTILDFSELGWLLYHLQINKFINEDINDLLSDFDLLIKKRLYEVLEEENYGLFYGAMNFMLYFLTRLKISDNLNKYSSIFDYFIRHIYKKADLISNDNLSWKNYLSLKYTKEKFYNFTFVYGVNSIISLCCMISQIYENYLLKKMIENGCKFEMSYKNCDNNSNSMFPIGVSGNFLAIKNKQIPLGWNIGDLMIGYTFLNASFIIKDDELKRQSINIINRTVYNNTEIKEYNIMSGSTGIGLIYYLIYRRTGNVLAKRNAKFWNMKSVDSILDMKKTNVDISYINGLSGAGLNLISFLSKDRPTWCESILL